MCLFRFRTWQVLLFWNAIFIKYNYTVLIIILMESRIANIILNLNRHREKAFTIIRRLLLGDYVFDLIAKQYKYDFISWIHAITFSLLTPHTTEHVLWLPSYVNNGYFFPKGVGRSLKILAALTGINSATHYPPKLSRITFDKASHFPPTSEFLKNKE